MPSAIATRKLVLGLSTALCVCAVAAAQQPAAPPAFLAVVEGTATLERNGDIQPAVRDMPFVAGDRLRTENGRVEIDFPDGTAIEVGSYSEVEAVSDSRVRLLAGTMDHLSRRAVTSTSSNYLPADLRVYGPTFDEYGSWNYDASYGYVWYPGVRADWRPYYYGSWAAVPSFGWTWIGLDAWSWPTHHYGRWGYARNAWFWIPGRVWSAAWVTWGVAPDYVSWCPLGFDGHPVFGLGGPGRPWHGWTIVARRDFGYRGRFANRDAIDPRRFDAKTPFVQTTRLPLAFGRAGEKFGSRGSTLKPALERRPATTPALDPRTTNPQRTRMAPPPSAGVAVGGPRGSTPGAGSRKPGTENPYRRAVPPVPRAFDPVVPPVSQPVVPPVAEPTIAPVAPTPAGKIVEPFPRKDVRPAPLKVEPLRPAQPAAPARDHVAAPPPPPPASSSAPPPRAAGVSAGKPASAPAKRPR